MTAPPGRRRQALGARPAPVPAPVLALVLAAVLAVAGCGGTSGGGNGGGGGDPVAAGERPPLVSLVRYGGIAGLREEVHVSTSGEVTVRRERSPAPVVRTLAAGDLDRLRTALARSEFATLDSGYLDRTAADAYQYDVTYQGRTVTTDDGVVPERLRPVLDLLVAQLAG